MSKDKKNNGKQNKADKQKENSRKSYNEKREIGTLPDTTLINRPNITKPNKEKD